MSVAIKRALVTGGTGGIGLATARTLAKQGLEVVVTGRDATKGAQVVAELRAATGNPQVEFLAGDLSTRASIDALVAAFGARFDRLDVLLNNAGLMPSERTLNADGVESGFAVNVLAPLRLATALLPVLKASPAPRVVTLTGGEHPARLELDNLQGERRFVGLSLYSHHKLVMMAAMLELAARWGASPTVNVCYPGQASTAMTQGVKASDLPWLMRPLFPLFRLMTRDDGGRSAEKASRASVFLATSPEVEGKTALYFSPTCEERAWPKALGDATVRAQVWREVERLGGAA